MSEQEVIKILNMNPCYREFHKEFQGKFILYYLINGVEIIFYNRVGGDVEALLTMTSDLYNVDVQVQDFIDISKRIIQQKINSKDAYNPL